MTTYTQEDFDKAVEGLEETELEAGGEPKEPVELKEPPKPKYDEIVLDGDDIPAELKGKKLTEAFGVYNELKTLSQGLARRAAEAAASPPAPTKPPEPITPDDLIEGEGKNFTTKLERLLESKVAPLQNQVIQSQAQLMRSQALQSSEYLKKYQPTLDRIITEGNITQQQLAHPQMWMVLESLVMKQHMDDIVRERAAASTKPSPEPTAGVRATPEAGGGGAASLTAQQKAVADGLGLSHEAYARMIPLTNQG